MVSSVAPPRPIGELAGPSGRRWSGNLGAFESDRLHFLLRAKAEFGGLVRFDDLTSIVNDPQLAAHILLDREQLYAIRENFRGEVLTHEQIAETRQLRPTLNPGLRRSRAVRVVPSVASRMETELRQAIGSCVDPLPMLERAAAQSIASYYFGRDADVVLDGTRELLDALESHFGNPFALPAAWHTPGRRRILKRHHRLESIVVPLLRDRAQGHASQDQHDFATDVVQALSSRGGPTLERIAQMLIGSLLAAQRVPAAAAAWMLWEMARDEQLQARVRSEEADLFATALTRGAEPRTSEFPLANAIVLETLRLHPPTWLLHRTLLRDTAIGGYVAPRGHNFLISPYVIHRDVDYFDRPELFCIDRWERPQATTMPFFPFGRGPHGCPGNEVAMAMLVAILLTVLGECALRPGSGEVVANPRSTLVPSGLTIRFSRR